MFRSLIQHSVIVERLQTEQMGNVAMHIGFVRDAVSTLKGLFGTEASSTTNSRYFECLISLTTQEPWDVYQTVVG